MAKIIGVISNTGRVTLHKTIASHTVDIVEFAKQIMKNSGDVKLFGETLRDNIVISEFLPSTSSGFSTRLIITDKENKSRFYLMEKPPHAYEMKTQLGVITSIEATAKGTDKNSPQFGKEIKRVCSTLKELEEFVREAEKAFSYRSYVVREKTIGLKVNQIHMPWTYIIVNPNSGDAYVFISKNRLIRIDQTLWVAPLPNVYPANGRICFGSLEQQFFKVKDKLTLAERVNFIVQQFFDVPFNIDLFLENFCNHKLFHKNLTASVKTFLKSTDPLIISLFLLNAMAQTLNPQLLETIESEIGQSNDTKNIPLYGDTTLMLTIQDMIPQITDTEEDFLML